MLRMSYLLHVSKGEYHFKVTVLRAPKELARILPDLGFSDKWYFLCNFFFENFHSQEKYEGLNFYICELRCESEVYGLILQRR